MLNKFIKSLELRLSDLFLLIGFIPFAVFLLFGQKLMQTQNPAEVGFPLWACFVCFILGLASWGYYIFLEYKRNNLPKLAISCVFIFLALLNAVVIIAQPSQIIESVVCRNVNGNNEGWAVLNNAYPVAVTLSTTHRAFFACDIILICAFIYIGLFIFPKRFKSISFIKYLGWAVFAFLFVLIIAGWIMDGSKIPHFFKILLGKESGDLADYAFVSFIIHRNAYGMSMMLGIIFAFINHAITNKWQYYLLVAFFYIHLVLSWCKTGLIISTLLILAYVVYRIIVTFKVNKKRNLTISIVLGSILLIGIGIIAIALITEGKTFGKIYSIIKGDPNKVSSLFLRSLIWDNCYQLLRNGNWLIGRGFGTMNVTLFEMNKVNGDIVFPTHNSFLCLLTEGGIFFLLAFLALLLYSGKIVYESFKKNPGLTVAMSLGVVAFFLYGFVEAIQYLLYVFLLPLFILYETQKQQIEN